MLIFPKLTNGVIKTYKKISALLYTIRDFMAITEDFKR